MKIKSLFKMKSKKEDNNKISFRLPITEVKDNLITGSDGRVKICIKVSPINGDLFTDEQLEDTANSIQGALSSFEGRRAIYILSERVDIGRNLDNIEKRKSELNDEFKMVLLENQKEYLESMVDNTNSVINFYLVLEVKEKKNIAESLLMDTYQSVKNELETADMYCELMNKNSYLQLLYEKLNPEQSQVEPFQKDWELFNIYPQNAVRFEDGRHIEIENRLHRFYYISKFPQKVDKYRWLKKLLNIKGDVNIAITMTPKNSATINKELSRAVEELGGKAAAQKDKSIQLKYLKEQESAEQMIEDLGSDNISLFDTNITIGISAKNMEELNTLANIVRSKISSARLQSAEIKRKDFDPLYTTLPVLPENKITRDYVWNLTTNDIASIIPFDSAEYMEDSGTLVAKNATRGLIIVNYRNKIYNNSHMCILADSGSGKTFFIRTDVMRNMPYEDYTILFDIKGDLRFPWGNRHVFSATSGIVVNPFHIRNAIIDSDSEAEQGKVDVGIFLSQKIMDLIVFFRWIVDMTPYDESLLEEDIRDTYKECGLDFNSKELPKEFCTMGTLDEVMERKINSDNGTDMEIERRKYLRACIKPYTKGTYSKIFNGQTNWDFNSFLTVFDISNIPEAVKKPLYDILLKDTWQFCKKDGTVNPTLKTVVVDECHEFADPQNPQTLMFLSTKLSKQGRGFGVRLVTATQNLPDFLSIPRFGQAIIDNSYFKLFMRLGESDIPVAKKLYNFGENETKILRGTGSKKSGSKGKGIFVIGSQRVEIQTIASKSELEVIDPKQFEEIYGQKSRYMGL